MFTWLTRRANAGWLILAVFLVRAPGLYFDVLDIDETDTLLVGRLLGRGALPYVDVVEKKPLLFYLFYSPAALFGWRLWPLRLFAVGWVVATCLVVGRAARRWTGSQDVGRIAAWLCLLITACNTPSLSAEMMLNLPAAGALYFFVCAEKRRSPSADLLTGICAAGASLFKHQGGIVLVALGFAFVWQGWRLGRGAQLRRLGTVLAGFIAPWLLCGGVYAALGHFHEFAEWNVYKNLFYSSSSSGWSLPWFLWRVGGYIVGAAPLLWLLALRETRARNDDPVRAAAVILLWLTFIPVCLGGRFYDHYFLQFAPPLALLVAAPLTALLQRGSRLLALALLLPVVGHQAYLWTFGALGNFPTQDPKVVELAGFVAEHSRPEERLFVWGHFTPIYYLSRRMPGTRYYNTSVLVGDFDPYLFPRGFDPRPFFSKKDIGLALDDLDERRPELVVDTAPADIHDWSKFPLAMVPELAAYVERNYELVGRPAGAAVYRRRANR